MTVSKENSPKTKNQSMSPNSLIGFFQTYKHDSDTVTPSESSKALAALGPNSNDLISIIQEKLLSLPSKIESQKNLDLLSGDFSNTKKRSRPSENDSKPSLSSSTSKVKISQENNNNTSVVNLKSKASQPQTEKVVQRYNCKYCPKSFTRPSSLTIHTYTHTGEKPHECTFPECKKRFSVLSNLRRHLKLHKSRHSIFLNQPSYPTSGSSVSNSIRFPYFYPNKSSNFENGSGQLISQARSIGHPILPKSTSSHPDFQDLEDNLFYNNSFTKSTNNEQFSFNGISNKRFNSLDGNSLDTISVPNNQGVCTGYAGVSKSYISNSNKIIANTDCDIAEIDFTTRDIASFGILDFQNNNIFGSEFKKPDFKYNGTINPYFLDPLTDDLSSGSGISFSYQKPDIDFDRFNNDSMNTTNSFRFSLNGKNQQVSQLPKISTNYLSTNTKVSIEPQNLYSQKYESSNSYDSGEYSLQNPFNKPSNPDQYPYDVMNGNLKKSFSGDSNSSSNVHSASSNSFDFINCNNNYPLKQDGIIGNQWYDGIAKTKFFGTSQLTSVQKGASYEDSTFQSAQQSSCLLDINQHIPTYPEAQISPSNFHSNNISGNSGMYL
ncbi:Zinc finger protein [Smittium mucronatum]|uniref:Zinc finger protein n=1 Tax=Smittium mucronatum TaxID=133383 RepID=A0A1R0H5T1_9FUNG|nr:Zinc finger protein [Smittium mucronatum]